MRHLVSVSLLGLILGGCASTPPVTVNYYLPKGTLDLQLARSVACSTNDAVYESTKLLSSTMTYSADTSAPQAMRIRDFESSLASSEIGLTFTEDGRLSTLNTTQTGQGSQIIDTAIGLAGLALGLATDVEDEALAEACRYVRENGKDNVITLTYVLSESFTQTLDASDQPVDLPMRRIGVVLSDQDRLNAMQPLLRELCFHARKLAPRKQRIEYARGTRTDVEVKLREPVPVETSIVVGSETGCPKSSDIKDETARLWRATLLVPQFGAIYPFPVPAAQPFGKQMVKVGLAESGAVTSLTYGSEQGASTLAGTIAKAITEFEEDSSATKAAEIKAQADIIAQQERLLACRASPSTCPRS